MEFLQSFIVSSGIGNQYPFLGIEFFGNTVFNYFLAGAVFFLVFAFLLLFRKVILMKLRSFARKTKSDLDDLFVEILYAVGIPFYLLLSAGIALQFISYPSALRSFGAWIAFLVVAYSIVRALTRSIDFAFNKVITKRLEEGQFDPSVVRVLMKVLKSIVWGIAFLIVVQNAGYNITALVAGLGIGGVAIALALQGVLSDVFASFSIYFDKPFQTGDFIIVGEDMGTVSHIGIKSTRIATLQGEELVMSNKELTEARVHNHKKMEKRRIGFQFGVTYDTPAEKLKRIPQMVKDIIGAIEVAKVDRVHFKELGDSGLNFDVVYYIDTPDYNAYMDAQQEINLQLKETFEKEGIEFAYPTQTLYLQNSAK